jgi:CRP/FNR family transcriptional regulator
MIPKADLTSLSLFNGASAATIDAVATHAVDVRFGTDEMIFASGSQSRGWFIVIEGRVRVVRGEGGRQHVIHTEGPGGTLGEVPLLTGEPYPATAVASEPTRCALLTRAAIDAASRESPEIGLLLSRCLAFRVKHLVERLNDRSARSVRARLVDHLLARRTAAPKATVSMGMTQHELAEELGTVREVLARELQALVKLGAISPAGSGRYRINDIELLASSVASRG